MRHALQSIACQPLHVVLVCKGGPWLAHLQLQHSTHSSTAGSRQSRTMLLLHSMQDMPGH
jgi:hypothetical protein